MRTSAAALLCLLGCTDRPEEVIKDAGKPTPAQPQTLETGDLDALSRRGTLRILVQADENGFLPRQGLPAVRDVEEASRFARAQGLEPVLVGVESYADLIPALIEGRGDLIVAQFTVTASRSTLIDFSRPTAAVSELLVGPKGAKPRPRRIEDLAGHTIHVRRSSSYFQTLETLKVPGLKVEAAAEDMDAESLVYSVSEGTRPWTIVDSHIFAATQSYLEGVEAYFPVAKDRRLAWGLRKGAPKLKTALNAFIVRRAMLQDVGNETTDLDGIRERGVLRVLTRNNPMTYFLFRGRQYGFEYELTQRIAKELGVRLEVVVPPSRELLIPWLLEGRGDFIAAALTVNDARRARIQFSEPYLFTQEYVLRTKGATTPSSAADLQAIEIRKSSSYFQTLKSRYPKVTVIAASEDLETEDLIARVAQGLAPATAADAHIADLEIAYGVEVEKAFALAPEQAPIAFGVRPNNPALLAHLSRWVKTNYRGLHYNILKKRYLQKSRRFALAKDARLMKSGRVSKYDDIFRKYAKRYELDWRLLAAQAYVESQFDPQAESWVGAKGLLQVMPRTGRSLGFTRLTDPEQGVHAGAKYLHRLMRRLEPDLELKARINFALAGYNAGYGHLLDARRLAAQKGWDRTRWFGHVERAMLLLAKPEYAKKARHGYVRGGQPVAYVRSINRLYAAYVSGTQNR